MTDLSVHDAEPGDELPVGEDYVSPADRPAEWARMARELAASGYSEDQITRALAVDEVTVQRLLEAREEGLQ